MTGNNQPLYVVDGVPLDNTNFGSAAQTEASTWATVFRASMPMT